MREDKIVKQFVKDFKNKQKQIEKSQK